MQYRSGDTEYRYRPDSDLLYLGGIVEPGAVLVVGGSGNEVGTVLFLPDSDPSVALWNGPRTAPEEAVARYGVDEAYSTSELEGRLAASLVGSERVFYRLGRSEAVDRSVLRCLEQGRVHRNKTGRGLVGVLDSGLIMDGLRLVKDAWEIQRIRAACEVTIAGHMAGLATVAPGVGEWDVEAEIEVAFRRAGATGPAFGTIVGSADNGCVLHYTANARRMQDGELVLIDAGAEVDYYSGDVTRTVPVSGKWTPEQLALYEVVEQARVEAVSAVAPGVGMETPHEAARAVLVQGLVDLGLLSGDPAARIEAGDYKRFIPHRTSHWLGLDVHDVGTYRVGDASRVLEPGVVLTVEPGVYVPSDATDVPERFRGLGIRIEDDVLVTADGRENLTQALPTDPDALGALLADRVRTP